MEKKIPVWMDCDTGTDDAMALLLASKLPELELQGISAVNGNTCLQNAFLNTHRVVGLMGKTVPVYPGAEKPLIVPPVHADEFHGKNGLGDVELPIPADAVMHEEKAWDALYECAKKNGGGLRLIATGPLTNVAIAFTKYPDLPGMLHTLLIMGGSTCGGNITPAAEFNIYADYHGADIVFRSGVPIVMCGLDVTLKAELNGEDLDAFAALGNRAGRFVHDMLQCGYRTLTGMGYGGVAQHDSCPVMYLAHPELFRGEKAGVVVETRSSVSNGKTVTDLYSDRQFGFQNAFVVLDVDWPGMKEIMMNTIGSLA